VVLGLPAFLPALAAVATSGALVTLPARVARAFAPGFGLATAEPPIPVRSFPVSVFWHRRNDTDPRTSWIRQQLRSATGFNQDLEEHSTFSSVPAALPEDFPQAARRRRRRPDRH
jgi:DNA-binding transcriptional LysR family regulator